MAFDLSASLLVEMKETNNKNRVSYKIILIIAAELSEGWQAYLVV